MALHAYVDESKKNDYIIAAALVPESDVTAARSAMRKLLTGGQHRIHFRDERQSRKQAIISEVLDIVSECRIYVSSTRRQARENCLIQLVPDLADAGVSRLVIELDTSTQQLDRRTIFAATTKAGGGLDYAHRTAHQEPLLWAPDAVAWCWANGGRWQRLLKGKVSVIDAA